MILSLEGRWEGLVEALIRAGHYASPSDVVHAGLRLIEERDAKLIALRETLNASIAAGGRNDEDDLIRLLDAEDAELEKAGL